MKCPNCGKAKLVHDTRDMPYTYKGESTVIPAVKAAAVLGMVAAKGATWPMAVSPTEAPRK